MGVATGPISRTDAATGRGYPARVVVPGNQLHVVSAPLAGMVESLSAAINQPVKKGQRLATLQSPSLVEIQRGLLQAATQAQLARESMARDEQLFKEGIIAEGRYLASRSRNAEAVAALAERRQALRLAGVGEAALHRLEKGQTLYGALDVVAPANGVILEQMAAPGQRVDAAAPLFKLAQLAPLWLEIQVPVGLAAGLKREAVVSVPAYRASGKITHLGQAVEEGSQTVTVRAEIREGAENLRPGQFVEAMLAAHEGGRHWHVPNGALVRLRDQAYVFVQIPAGFRAQAVRLAGESAGDAAIEGDFKEGDRIAVRGTALLKAMWQGLAAGGE
jgi:RND family efflux transporter MFP subunit